MMRAAAHAADTGDMPEDEASLFRAARAECESLRDALGPDWFEAPDSPDGVDSPEAAVDVMESIAQWWSEPGSKVGDHSLLEGDGPIPDYPEPEPSEPSVPVMQSADPRSGRSAARDRAKAMMSELVRGGLKPPKKVAK